MTAKATSMAAGNARGRVAAHQIALIGLVFLLAAAPVMAGGSENSAELMISYLESYQKLGPRDVEGRMGLAEWCGVQGMAAQQADLLREVLKIQPRNVEAYRKLLSADQQRTLDVDPDWAAKLEALLGPEYHLYHGAHFTVLTDAPEVIAVGQAEAMEEVYKTFYRECTEIGLTPMPPGRRLVSFFFSRHRDYADFLRRFEGVASPFADGYYSWLTNRVVFFHDYDHPVFQEARQALDSADRQIARLRASLKDVPASDIGRRKRMQEQLKKQSMARFVTAARLNAATRQTTLMKSRHEIAHQLFCNSGIQPREGYPRWLGEGLAICFEASDVRGRAGPSLVDPYRLTTYRRAASAGNLWPLKTLISTAPQDADGQEKIVIYYAQAWALTHYLWNERTDRFRAYLEAMAVESDSGKWPVMFNQHFGDVEALGRDLSAYMDSLPKSPR